MITGASSMLGTLVGAVTATVSVLGNALFSTVIALYILIDKEEPSPVSAASCSTPLSSPRWGTRSGMWAA